ncbi:MAG: hypothetical protein CMM91_06350 [Rickettsiales bacterium]|nr:hypothetical protein [Rickettsiales bacterium]OUV53419.1 MAG: hypothetical protein CBC87_04330 [Rickettsiales bacterium TMED127]|tara:strand:- start:19771 stop:20481 length:711 start_codon:yes stop_codon:yes gene_type:complete
MTRDHKLFLKWLLQFSLIFFFFYFIWDQGLIGELISKDRSYITSTILIIFLIICCHCAYATFLISSELNKAHVIKKNLLRPNVKLKVIDNNLILSSKGVVSEGIVSDYFKDLLDLKKNGINGHSQILDTYVKKTNGYYELGWFSADLMLKLGLIGTVIGFIIMLGSLSDITTFDVTLLQGVLTTMGSGMGVALYTTLSALVTGVLIALQYFNLESGCEELFSVLNQISEVSINKSF